MKILHETDYVVFSYDAVRRLLLQRWKPENTRMTDRDFMEAFDKRIELVVEYRVPIVVDMTQSGFTINPDLQRWSFERLKEAAALTADPPKAAFVMSKDIFAQISGEQTLEELREGGIYNRFRYFNSEEEAVEWLLS